jgi:hypothetical protein
MVRIINYYNPIQPLYESGALKMTSTMCMKINILKTHLGAMLRKKKLHGPNSRANYTDRATADCRRSDCQLLRIESATWSA